jgi:hypothetical protein
MGPDDDGDVFWTGESWEVNRSNTEFKMEDACIICNVIEILVMMFHWN